MHKKKILIVDDEAQITDMAKAILEETGLYEVCRESRASRAMATAKAFHPDLVLCDIVMPEMEGPQVANVLRSDESCRNVPIVFLTSLVTDEEIKPGGGAIGGFPYISKPIRADELIRRVEEQLKNSPRS